MRTAWRHILVFVLVISAVGAGSFFLTRHFLSSGEEAAAGGTDPATIAARKKAIDERNRVIEAEQAAPKFSGEIGEYFFVADPAAPLPPDYAGPPPVPGPCKEQVPVTAADTELYTELPAKVDDTDITPTGPPMGQACGDIVAVGHRGTVPTLFGPQAGLVGVGRELFYHPRALVAGGYSRDELVLTTIAGKPALLIGSPGPLSFGTIMVVERPLTGAQPGVVASVGGELPLEQLVRLAEMVVGNQ